MTNQDNPYGSGTSYSVSFGAPAQAGGDAAAAAGATVELVKDTTTAGFTRDVIQESRQQPVLVDFWAPWCGPCKQLTPVLEKEVRAAGGKVKLVKMNIDDHPAIAGQLGIQSIPAVIAFKNGQPVDGFMGAIPESQVRDFIQKVAGPGAGPAAAEVLAAAKQAQDSGDVETAVELYSSVLQHAPETVEAIAGLADVLFETGDREAARQLLESAPKDKQGAPALAAVQAKLTLAEQVTGLGDPAELERRLAANPKDHQARFDLAMLQNARGQRMEAADNLLAIMRADRGWNDDGARTQLLKLFEAWGMTDEATLAARRKLSTLLFS